jgi:hypothetical protein
LARLGRPDCFLTDAHTVTVRSRRESMLCRLRPACHSPLLRALQRSKMTLSHALLPPVQVPARMEITLTETEDQLCTLLDESAHWMKEHKGISTSCRIAGGWVRDKVASSVVIVYAH